MVFGGSLLAALPKGFFNWPVTMEDGSRGYDSLSVSLNENGDGRKRQRINEGAYALVGGSRTPTLMSPPINFCDGADAENENGRPLKRFRSKSKIVAVPHPPSCTSKVKPKSQQSSSFLRNVPEDAIAHCLSFLGSAQDRFALQTTCKLFRDISNSDTMLAQVSVSGNLETGTCGIIQDHDTPSTAASALAPFARAGNLEALYM